MEKIKIAVVDDHNLFRKGIISLLGQSDALEIAFEAENGSILLEKLAKNPVDVILLDLDMPVMSGREALEIIKEKLPEIKVIVLTLHDDEVTIAKMIEMGANGFLAKDDSIDLVLKAILMVFEKDYFFTKRVLKVIGNSAKKAQNKSVVKPEIAFSKREEEIIKLICQEYSAKEIACKLNTSARTVEWHRKNMYSQTNTKNTAGVVYYAVKTRIVN